MAPFHFWPVLWLTLPALLLVTDAGMRAPPGTWRWSPWRKSAAGRAAEAGWWFGFGYHLVGLFWIGEAFLVEAEVFAWLMPLAVTLLPAGLALFTALATAGLALAHWRTPVDRVLVLALTFGGSEWLRGHILTGFPWNVLGYALTWPLALMQNAAVLGIYGLTVVVVVIFAAPYTLLSRERRRHRWQLPLAGVAALITMFAAGQVRLAALPMSAETRSGPLIRIVQPSISQRDRMQAENQRRIFDRHLELSQTAPDGTFDAAAGIDVIVWPEVAMPFAPLAQPVAMSEIGTLLQGPTRLISGALRVAPDEPGMRRSVYNSLLVFEGGIPARHIAAYDKIKLVPFGEYLPAQDLLEWIGLQQLTRQRGGFSKGREPRVLLEVPGLGRVLPLICYEAVFPGLLAPAMGQPDLMLTLTNDGWFGTTTGPRQHYHQGRVRAVETGVPLIRASTNGISALVDPLGRERGRLDLNAVGTIDVRLPPTLPPTAYLRWGDSAALLLMLAIGVTLFLRHSR